MSSLDRPVTSRLLETIRDHGRRLANLERPALRVVPLVDDVADLPAAPREGQRADLWASGTAGTGPIWTLTWRGAANSGSGAWMASGPPLVARGDSSTYSTASTSYVTAAGTALPPLSLPAAMLAHFEWGAITNNNTAAEWTLLVPTAVGLVDVRTIRHQHATASRWARVHRAFAGAVSASSGVQTFSAKVTGGTGQWTDIELLVHPVEIRP